MGLVRYEHFLQNRPYLDYTDDCYYFLEITEGGFNKSEANRLVNNFKKPIDRKDKPEWWYRNKAIEEFVNLLLSFSPFQNSECIVAPMSTSKSSNSLNFNDRLYKTVQGLSSKLPKLRVEYLFDVKSDIVESHLGGTRNKENIKNNIAWNGFTYEPKEYLFLIDDVLTTGAHFKACKEIINSNYPNIKVVGIFLALYTK